MPFNKAEITITTLDEWERHAGPKSAHQWVDGRSAKEAARAWLAGEDQGLPTEVALLLRNHKRFGEVLGWSAEPEAKLRFDSFPGEPRNSDLAVHATDEAGPYLIAVEAKADESYGETVERTILTAERRLQQNPRSNGLVRVEQLCQALFGVGAAKLPKLRYQLLTACAGALCEAERKGYTRAVMLVHEFITSKTKDDNHARNFQDLLAFLTALSVGATESLAPESLNGPFFVPGHPLVKGRIELYVGKVTRNLRAVGV